LVKLKDSELKLRTQVATLETEKEEAERVQRRLERDAVRKDKKLEAAEEELADVRKKARRLEAELARQKYKA
jgi:predicted  nucleic acid-binding Zn-ribbon protein